ncbi:glutamine synthetase adenylyltransferase [Stratiformator vulcanicus]|uniref:Glutamate-ammonia-ligase adenylyltransferase n=1 Tax=Stratiformator vulcanicus TaxID=2527980 RepID=A0A517QY96_9PLAN|nr:glutamine synthetase adenylyltransferase [Stratiformator vulcanicus]QDT36605.1 Glutamate-ammonia-ligase adenylyltransferase [Stratiformator vulcanicus]
MFATVGFADRERAARRLEDLCDGDEARAELARCLPALLVALSEAATPDGSLVNFERYVLAAVDRAALFRYLAEHPRAVEILVRLFINSQFLTEILLRNPNYLERLTNHKRIADVKSREEFYAEAYLSSKAHPPGRERFDALRRYQHWELLRIGAGDSFGLLDLKTVTVQLSLLADSLVRACLTTLAEQDDISTDGFCIVAFGKLGGEELNYSSDIDLVFLADGDATRFWSLGQKLIKALMEATGEGFLYRVDMRLRPWGRSGALVNTVESHLNYLHKHGQAWEKQAMLKARVIAGDEPVGLKFLSGAEPLIYRLQPDEIRLSVRESKEKIEAELERKGRLWGEVKSGAGSIRDIEFVVQSLQLIHGRDVPGVRSFNTVDALRRLADFSLLQADEYRQLVGGYNFLRTVEHSIQLMHHKQTHTLPQDRRELAYLARRLDYPDADSFRNHYEKHVETIRAIYLRYVGDESTGEPSDEVEATPGLADHLWRTEDSYRQVFSDDDRKLHARMIRRLSTENTVEVDAILQPDGRWRVTVAGLNSVGDLSMICGLLFVYGFDILNGHVFTDSPVSGRRPVSGFSKGEFVNVFTVTPPPEEVTPNKWIQFEQDLESFVGLVVGNHRAEAQGRLAKRVAEVLREVREDATEEALLPVEIDIDNDASELFTVLHIQAEDTIGFLYELTNALAMSGYDVGRVIVSTTGNRVFDTLYVTDPNGRKITAEDDLRRLRAAVVLIKNFTHLLPRSPNPEAALIHFRELVEQLFRQENWLDDLARLEQSKVLDGLARLLGISDFLWEDFLRLQYATLLPVVTDIEGLAETKDRNRLGRELAEVLDEPLVGKGSAHETLKRRLNDFKDREMFRVDMRHILGNIEEFGQFSDELTAIAETVVDAAYRLALNDLHSRYGTPCLESGEDCPLTIAALGKCGGRELGFASDIELMFLYGGGGRTDGDESIRNSEFFTRLIELFNSTIESRQEGIFQVDLRLRPYGRAGSPAVPVDAFETYFSPTGPAWPFERQALVKFRPIAGDVDFGYTLLGIRDRLIYTGEPFDATAMRAMREKQVRQLVQAGTFNAKLSPGGLVDTEYLVQGLQITHGSFFPPVRSTNTLEALSALSDAGIVPAAVYERLVDAYIFQRRLIDALRMVRGNARDLTVPSAADEKFDFLARRLGYGNSVTDLAKDIERQTAVVQEMVGLLGLR